MKIGMECVPCFVRQAFEAVNLVTDDPKAKERILKQVLFRLANQSFDKTTPSVGADIHRIVRVLSGDSDPYREVKKDSNMMAQKLLPTMRELIKNSEDHFETAVRLAIAGNIIDSGQGEYISEQKISQAISQCLEQRIRKDSIKKLREEIEKAAKILYLGDNAGEVFFDRLLIEQLNGHPLTYAVRGAPIINDALKDDAKKAGLDTLVEVIDNGSDAPGTILEQCSEEFKERFRDADLVIAKGQGNYESLSDEERKIIFLLKVKCPVIASHIGCREGDIVIASRG